MVTRDNLRYFATLQPFRPFRIHMASGRTFDIRHPEMIEVRSNIAMIFSSETADLFESVSLMLMESVHHIDVPVA